MASPHDPATIPEFVQGGNRFATRLGFRFKRKYGYFYDPKKTVTPPAWATTLLAFVVLRVGTVGVVALGVVQAFLSLSNYDGFQIGLALVSFLSAGLMYWLSLSLWRDLENTHREFLSLVANRRYEFTKGITPYLDAKGVAHAPGIPRALWDPATDAPARRPKTSIWARLNAARAWCGQMAERCYLTAALDWVGILPALLWCGTVLWPASAEASPPPTPAPTTPTFTFADDGEDLPEPRSDTRWTMRWVPFTKKPSPHSKLEYRKHLLLDKSKANTAFTSIAQWLHEQCPERHEVVMQWFASQYGRDFAPGPDGRPLIATDRLSPRHVEYLEGCLVASDPYYAAYDYPPGGDWDPIRNLLVRLRSAPALPANDPGLHPTYPTEASAADLFWGIGYVFEESHTQAWNTHAAYSLSEVTSQVPQFKNDIQGEPRIGGIGHKQRGIITSPKTNLKQHCGIWGTTGCGKTRTLEQLVVQLVTGGHPCIFLDPKGDFDLIDRYYEIGRMSGRAHQIYYFDLAKPKNANISSYNPLFHYRDPSYLGDRIGAIIAQTSDPFWRDQAVATARRVFTAVHWVRDYLRFLDRRIDQTGRCRMPPKTSDKVPLALLVQMYRSENKGLTVAQARDAVIRLLTHIEDSTFVAKDNEKRTLAMARMPEFTPRYWNPTIRHISSFLDKTTEMLGWMIKITHFHAFAEDGKHRDAESLMTTKPEEIVPGAGGQKQGGGQDPGAARGAGSTMWEIMRGSGTHPLRTRLPRENPVKTDIRFYAEIFQDLVIDQGGADHASIIEMMSQLRLTMEAICSWAQQDRSKFLEMNTTLATALVRFQGDRENLVCSLNPKIRWDKVVHYDQLVYINANANIDSDGAMGLAKMAVQDLASYVGTIYDQHRRDQGDPKQFFLIIDEIRYAVNDGIVQLLAMARGAGCSVTIAGQTLANLRAGLGGDENKAKEIIDNLSTFVQMRGGGVEDAEFFAKKCGNVVVNRLTRSQSLQPGPGDAGNELIKLISTSYSIQPQRETVQKIQQDLIPQLPRGMAMIYNMGGGVNCVAVGMFPKPNANIKLEFGTFDSEAEADEVETLWAQAALAGSADAERLRAAALLKDQERAVTAALDREAKVIQEQAAANATADKAEALFSPEERSSIVQENAAAVAKLNSEVQARTAKEKAAGQRLASAPHPPAGPAAPAGGPRPTDRRKTPPPGPAGGSAHPPSPSAASQPAPAAPAAAAAATLRPTDPTLNAATQDPTSVAAGFPGAQRYTDPSPPPPLDDDDLDPTLGRGSF